MTTTNPFHPLPAASRDRFIVRLFLCGWSIDRIASLVSMAPDDVIATLANFYAEGITRSLCDALFFALALAERIEE